MNNENTRKIIMDNYLNPYNRLMPKGEGYVKANTRNESCIDNIDLYVKFDGDKLADITFMGDACAISISSASIMIKNLIGKTKDEALKYILEFEKMIDGKEFNKELLKDACVYEEISKQGSRKVCASLPLKGIKKAILEFLE